MSCLGRNISGLRWCARRGHLRRRRRATSSSRLPRRRLERRLLGHRLLGLALLVRLVLLVVLLKELLDRGVERKEVPLLALQIVASNMHVVVVPRHDLLRYAVL